MDECRKDLIIMIQQIKDQGNLWKLWKLAKLIIEYEAK